MNDRPRIPELHPEEELASYVDGSATEDERRLVEAHLAGCSSCRADLELAERGHAAMKALPDVDAPGLAEQSLGWLSPEDGEVALERGVVARPRRRRSSWRVPSWQRVAWGAGLAAAAAVVALFVFAGLWGSSNHTTTAARGAAVPSANSLQEAPALRSDKDYDATSVNALARRLAQQGGTAVGYGTAAGTAPVPAAASQFSGAKITQALDQAATVQAVGCLQRGAGLGPNVPASYVEVASFDGKPAFIGAFPSSPTGGGTATQLLVIAVDQLSCQALYLVTLSL